MIKKAWPHEEGLLGWGAATWLDAIQVLVADPDQIFLQSVLLKSLWNFLSIFP